MVLNCLDLIACRLPVLAKEDAIALADPHALSGHAVFVIFSNKFKRIF
jgi:hypothetical protein